MVWPVGWLAAVEEEPVEVMVGRPVERAGNFEEVLVGEILVEEVPVEEEELGLGLPAVAFPVGIVQT